MILSALLLAAAPTRIALIGPDASGSTATIAGILGPSYSVQGFANAGAAKGFGPNIVILSVDASTSGWANARDGFVPRIERDLGAISSWSTHPRLLLLQPAGSTALIRDEVVPLLRQAARESGVSVLLPDADTAAARVESITDAVADPKVSKRDWKLVSADSEQVDEGPAKNAIDGDPDTYWHTQYDPVMAKHPHQLIVDLGHEQSIGGFRYVPRQDGGVNGRVKKYAFFVSRDGQTWTGPVASGEFANTADPSSVKLKPAVKARYFKFVALSEVNGQPYATAAEIDVLRAAGGG